jgi:uncharacterized protein YrrD
MLDKKNLLQLDEFRGKSILSTSDGQRVGHVEDVLIDPGNMKLEGIVTSRGGFLRPDVRVIDAKDIEVWGIDAVLVRNQEVIVKREEVASLENCLSASEQIQGRDVITMEGQRIGELRDLLVDINGKLAGYEISKVPADIADRIDINRRRSYALPVESIHSFGKDVLIVDLKAVIGLTDDPVIETPDKELNKDPNQPIVTPPPAGTPFFEENKRD